MTARKKMSAGLMAGVRSPLLGLFLQVPQVAQRKPAGLEQVGDQISGEPPNEFRKSSMSVPYRGLPSASGSDERIAYLLHPSTAPFS